MSKTEWSGIHTRCGGQLQALPNSVDEEIYRCLACGEKVLSDDSIVFRADSENLEPNRNPADVLQLTREERKQLSSCETDEQVRRMVEELLSEKTIF